MYGVGSSQVIARDSTSLLFSSTFKHPDEELAKNREFMNSSDLYHHHNHLQQQQQQQSSGLMRYRSAPSSLFATLIDGDGGGGAAADGCDDFLNHQSSNSETETMFARLMNCNGSGDSDSHDLQFPTAIKHETVESGPQQSNGYSARASTSMVYQTPLPNRDSVSAHTSFSNNRPIESTFEVKSSGGRNGLNLMRQSSSPAEFFSNLTVENGVAAMRDAGNFKVGNGSNGETNPSINRLPDHLSFSSGRSSSRFMPQIAENGNENMETGSPENEHLGNDDGSNRCYVPSFPNDSWNESTFTSRKRNREDDVKMFSSFNSLDTQNGDRRNYNPGLTHHLSLPKTSAEMAAIEKYLQFQQDQVPCKIRAKRGFATHPRSIAERMRRTRISERMRKLQELFPNMDKQTNTADMLDLAVEYIKDLQKQLKTLTDARAKCTCLGKQKHSNPTT